MNAPQSYLLLIGSAKPAGESTSESLGTYLTARLEQTHGLTGDTIHVARAMRTEARIQQLLTAVDHVDLVVLASPLYVDSLPYLVTGAMERIAAFRQAQVQPKAGALLAIVNCGFPEADHNQTALAICEQFALESRMDWAGGLALGGGGAIHGQPLTEAGGMLRDVVAALDRTADALATGRPAPPEAIARLAQPIMSPRLYTFVGDIGWRMQAWRNGVFRSLRDQPLLP